MRGSVKLVVACLALGAAMAVQSARADEFIYRYRQGLPTVSGGSPTDGSGSGSQTGGGDTGSSGGGSASSGSTGPGGEAAKPCVDDGTQSEVTCALALKADSSSGKTPVTVTMYSPVTYMGSTVTRCFHIDGGYANFALIAQNDNWRNGSTDYGFSTMYFVPYKDLSNMNAYAYLGRPQQVFFPDPDVFPQITHERDMCLMMFPLGDMTLDTYPQGAQRIGIYLGVADYPDSAFTGAEDANVTMADSQAIYLLSVDIAGWIHPEETQ